jgi:DnaJ family protein C protein 22
MEKALKNDRRDRENTRQNKSKFWAYLLWLFGGLFGAHHVYLGRDDQAFVYISTFGGYMGLGWLRDVYRIPAYVADANDDPAFIEDFKRKVRTNRKVNTQAFQARL